MLAFCQICVRKGYRWTFLKYICLIFPAVFLLTSCVVTTNLSGDGFSAPVGSFQSAAGENTSDQEAAASAGALTEDSEDSNLLVEGSTFVLKLVAVVVIAALVAGYVWADRDRDDDDDDDRVGY